MNISKRSNLNNEERRSRFSTFLNHKNFNRMKKRFCAIEQDFEEEKVTRVPNMYHIMELYYAYLFLYIHTFNHLHEIKQEFANKNEMKLEIKL